MKSLLSVAFTMSLGLTGIAQAHTHLAESSPAQDAVLEQAPTEIILRFSDKVRLTALKVVPQQGSAQTLGPLPKQFGKAFAAPVGALPAGAHVIHWRALSTDTHVLTGQIAFEIRPVAD